MSVRDPVHRRSSLLNALILLMGLGAGLSAGPAAFAAPPKAQAAPTAKASAFATFLAALWRDAQARGISRRTFDAAFQGVTPDPSIVALTRKQSEFVRPIWGYLDSAVSAGRLQRGQAMARDYAADLAAIERKYGVSRHIVLGIWGMETHFGSYTGDKDVIRSLATLAFARYRGDFFRDELLIALKMLEDGVARRSVMRGSWAGAMGHTQFMPSSFVKYAVDHDGDGLRDLWGNIPDALASTAHYLASFGWEPGVPWGVEVRLPPGFDLASARDWRSFSDWSAAGLRGANGERLPGKGKAMLYLPAGLKGPALLVSENYRIIKKYNSSDAYALGVAHLGDRIAGGEAFVRGWPRQEKRLSLAEIKDLQRRLAALGYPIGKIDGRIGETSRDIIRQYQAKNGLPADGYPTPALLQRLRHRT